MAVHIRDYSVVFDAVGITLCYTRLRANRMLTNTLKHRTILIRYETEYRRMNQNNRLPYHCDNDQWRLSYTHTHTHTRTHARAHARTHARTHIRTHTTPHTQTRHHTHTHTHTHRTVILWLCTTQGLSRAPRSTWYTNVVFATELQASLHCRLNTVSPSSSLGSLRVRLSYDLSEKSELVPWPLESEAVLWPLESDVILWPLETDVVLWPLEEWGCPMTVSEKSELVLWPLERDVVLWPLEE